jgi:hypothetical protein
MMRSPHAHKIISAVVHIKPHYRYALTICILGAVFAVWYVGLYQYLEQTIALQHKQIAQLDKQASSYVQADVQSAQLNARIKILQTTLDEVNAQQQHNKVVGLMQMAAAAGLRVQSCSLLGNEKKDIAEQVNISLDAQGSMQQVQKFFCELQAAKPLAAVDMLQFERAQGDGASVKCVVSFLTKV